MSPLPNLRNSFIGGGSSLLSGTSRNLSSNNEQLSSLKKTKPSEMDDDLFRDLKKELTKQNAKTAASVREVTHTFMEKRRACVDLANVNDQGQKTTTNGPPKENSRLSLLVPSVEKWNALRSMVICQMDSLADEVVENESPQEHPTGQTLRSNSDLTDASSDTNILRATGAMASLEDSLVLDFDQRNAFASFRRASIKMASSRMEDSILDELDTIEVESPDGTESIVFEQSGQDILCGFKKKDARYSMSFRDLGEFVSSLAVEEDKNKNDNGDDIAFLQADERKKSSQANNRLMKQTKNNEDELWQMLKAAGSIAPEKVSSSSSRHRNNDRKTSKKSSSSSLSSSVDPRYLTTLNLKDDTLKALPVPKYLPRNATQCLKRTKKEKKTTKASGRVCVCVCMCVCV